MSEIISKVKSLVGNNFSKDFCEAVLNRIQSFGCKITENDAIPLCFAMEKVRNHINNSCNVTSVPDGLFHIAVDMSCGEFLFAKKQTGQLEIADLDLAGAITSISEGDTSVSFNSDSTDESRFNQLLNYLLHNGEGEFVCYRKLKW